MSAKLAAEIGGRALTFAMAVVVARRLGPAGLGEFQYAWSIAWIVALAGDIGLSMYTTAEVARDPAAFRVILGRALSVRAALAVPILLALAIFTTPVVFYLSSALLALSFIDTIAHACRGLQQVGRDALLNTCARVALFLGGCWVLLSTGDLPRAAFWMMVAQGGLLAAIVARTRPAFTTSGWGVAVRDAFPIGLASIAAILYLKIDLILLYRLTDATTAGTYAAASRMYEAFMVIPAAVMAAAFPAMVAGRPGARRLATSLLMGVSAAAVPLVLLFASPALRIIFGYDSAAPALRILAVALVPTFLNSVLLHELLARRLQRVNALINAVALGANVALNLALIPRAGAIGAALAWLLTEIGIGAAAVAALGSTRAPEPRPSIGAGDVIPESLT